MIILISSLFFHGMNIHSTSFLGTTGLHNFHSPFPFHHAHMHGELTLSRIQVYKKHLLNLFFPNSQFWVRCHQVFFKKNTPFDFFFPESFIYLCKTNQFRSMSDVDPGIHSFQGRPPPFFKLWKNNFLVSFNTSYNKDLLKTK